MIEVNALETARFGILAGRLTDAGAAPEMIEKECRRLGIRMLTTRVDVGALSRVHALEDAGYQLMDTLVYYRRSMGAMDMASSSHADVRFRLADPSDEYGVAEVARKGFSGYFGHYHADPRLNHAAADAAYVEWAERSARDVSDQNPVILGEANGKIVCFLTVRRNGPEEMEFVLNAVDPEYQRRGVYSSLIAEALTRLAGSGVSFATISTQINNFAVQRVWCRYGFVPVRSIYTFHKWFD